MINFWNNREHIKNLPIYPTRGNHDCYFNDPFFENTQSNKYDNWKFEQRWYEKQFTVGENGEKISVVNLDSCLAMCAAAVDRPELDRSLMDEHTKGLLTLCQQGGDWEPAARAQQAWLADLVESQLKDDKIIWKTTNMHHNLAGMGYTDNPDIIKSILPLTRKGKYDVYFAGHAHMQCYAHIPDESTLSEDYVMTKPTKTWMETVQDFVKGDPFCGFDIEYFPQEQTATGKREAWYKKGEAYHQVTGGFSGRDVDDLCVDDSSIGKFFYTQNINYGYILVHATAHRLTIDYRGVVEPQPQSVMKTFMAWLNPQDNATEELKYSPDRVLYTVNIVNGEHHTESEVASFIA